MYESHYTHLFFRLWGAKEAGKDLDPKGLDPKSSLLGNSQNPFDAWFGDVVGKTNNGNRFFIIEFKREKNGIRDEVFGAKAKMNRTALYALLQEDMPCRAASMRGHFACYPDEEQRLSFEFYITAADPLDDQGPNSSSNKQGNSTSPAFSFDDFFEGVTGKSFKEQTKPKVVASDLGLTFKHFRHYIACMYKHFKDVKDDKGNLAVAAMFNMKTRQLTSFDGVMSALVNDLHDFLERMEQAIRNQPGYTGSSQDAHDESSPDFPEIDPPSP